MDRTKSTDEYMQVLRDFRFELPDILLLMRRLAHAKKHQGNIMIYDTSKLLSASLFYAEELLDYQYELAREVRTVLITILELYFADDPALRERRGGPLQCLEEVRQWLEKTLDDEGMAEFMGKGTPDSIKLIPERWGGGFRCLLHPTRLSLR